jgi:hypothetical protein
MRTVSYYDLLSAATELAYAGSTNQPAADQWSRWRRLFSKRLASAWERAKWPLLTRVEQRTFRAEWASGTSYSKTNEIFYTPAQVYYQSLRDSNSGNAPASGTGNTENSAYWAQCRTSYSPSRGTWLTATAYLVGDQVYYQPTNLYYQCHTAHTSSGTLVPDATGGNERWGVLTPFDRYVAYEQTGETKIGDTFRATQVNPRLFWADGDLDYSLSENGVQVVNDVPSVWLTFRTQEPVLKGDNFSATATYTANVSQVYYRSTTAPETYPGNFYNCVTTTSAGESPETTAAKWSVVEIPLFLERYLVQGAYADWLPGDGQNDKKMPALLEAERLISDQVLLLRGQQGQRGRVTVAGR